MHYTFDSFIVGATSRAALDAAKAALERRTGTPNPLVLYGKTGSGKSHLLHAIANGMRGNVTRRSAHSKRSATS